ncbi:hypothetical protein [Enterovirga sp.]|uniref:hypothetical protein n=1 Tax=Enterovirga sp. TaxID=2026350 RepID=UPI002B75A109|nr:hypothetical protein [Enterovirga sp.]HMO31337.1 hypothetical protein [Enterovirga sp.]
MPKKPSLVTDLLSALQVFVLGAAEKPQAAATIRKQPAGVDVDALEAEVERIEAERRKALVRGSDSDVEALDGKLAAANRAADCGIALRDELQRLLAEAEAREAADALACERAEAERLSRTAIESLQTRLPALFGDIRSVIRQVAEAEITVAAINAKLPAAEHVSGPEEWRSAPGREPEWIMAEEIVWCWCFENGNRLDSAMAARVADQDGGRGFLPNASLYAPANTPVVRRPFRKVTKFPETYGGHLRELAASIALPPIRAGEVAGWDFDGGYGGAERILAAIAEREAAPAAVYVERQPVVLYEPVSHALGSEQAA